MAIKPALRLKMFQWFNLKEFMNTHQEWHAFSEGVSESFCFWRAHYEPSKELLEALKSEHHYYAFGRVIGFIGLALFGVWIVKLLRERTKERRRE